MFGLKNKEYLVEVIFVIIFFVAETLTKNEFLLTFLVVAFSLLFFMFPSERKVKIWLWVIGTILGFLIEVGMGLVTRSQYWEYGSFFGVPLWLPFIWGLGFEAIYMFGIFIKKNIK